MGNLNEHVKCTHSEANIFCSKCDYKTTRKSSMKTHLQRKHQNIFVCQYCMKKFSWIGLMRHIKKVHKTLTDPTVIESLLETENKYACEHCNYQATHQSNLRAHIQSKHEKIKYTCNQCNKQFKWKHDLNRHLQSKH